MAITKENAPKGDEKTNKEKDLNQGEEKTINLNSSKDLFEAKKDSEPAVGEVSEKEHDELFKMREALKSQEAINEEMREAVATVLAQNKELMAKLSAPSKQSPFGVANAKSDYVGDLIDDYVEEPVIFFGFTCGLGIWGDKSMGQITYPPNGKIQFTLIVRSKRLTHKGVQVVSVSHFASNSKKEIEYLRNHSKFGIQFFENKEDIKAMDYTVATRLAESSNIVNTLSDIQMIARCKLENIQITNDPKVMRMQLTKVLAEKLMGTNKSIQYGEFNPSKMSDNRIVKDGVVPKT